MKTRDLEFVITNVLTINGFFVDGKKFDSWLNKNNLVIIPYKKNGKCDLNKSIQMNIQEILLAGVVEIAKRKKRRKK